jgi:hypothetical protein
MFRLPWEIEAAYRPACTLSIHEAAMQKNDLIEKSRESLEKFRKLPSKVRLQRLIARGTIDKDGEVLLGRDKKEKKA